MAEPKKNLKPVSDIQNPEENIPPSTSRPVLSGAKGIKQDPMLNTKDSSDDEVVPPSVKRRIVAPLNDNDTTTGPVDNTDEAARAGHKASDTEDGISSNSSAEVDVLAGQVNTKQQLKEQKAALDQRREQIETLIDEKTYFLPIKTPSNQRRIRKILIILIVIAALVVGFLYAAAEGYISGFEDFTINIPS